MDEEIGREGGGGGGGKEKGGSGEGRIERIGKEERGRRKGITGW